MRPLRKRARGLQTLGDIVEYLSALSVLVSLSGGYKPPATPVEQLRRSVPPHAPPPAGTRPACTPHTAGRHAPQRHATRKRQEWRSHSTRVAEGPCDPRIKPLHVRVPIGTPHITRGSATLGHASRGTPAPRRDTPRPSQQRPQRRGTPPAGQSGETTPHE